MCSPRYWDGPRCARGLAHSRIDPRRFGLAFGGGSSQAGLMRGFTATVLGSTLGTLLGGCASPCFDDGLAQGGCPSAETDTDATATATNTDTDSDSDSAEGTASADETAGSGGGGGLDCPDFEEILLPQTPTFQLVIDRSGSMDEDFGGLSRWEATEETLIAPGDGVVTQLQSQIRFGVALYSNPIDANTCPSIDTLAPQLDAADEIKTLLDASSPAGDTPTGESMDLIIQDLLADDWPGEKIIVLTTDGEPDTCEERQPETDEEIAQARGSAVDAVRGAFDQGIRTFVISVGDEVGEDHLRELANAGQGVADGDPDAEFYVANDTGSLLGAFESIIAGIRSCTFDLADPLSDQQAPGCEVTVNDTPVPYDAPDGWTQSGPMQIELQGEACAQIQQGVVIVELNCGCEE